MADHPLPGSVHLQTARPNYGNTLPKPHYQFEESGRPGKRPRLDIPPALTAAAAISEQKRQPHLHSANTSPNPRYQALHSLTNTSKHAMSPAASTYSMASPSRNSSMNPPLSIVSNNLSSVANENVSGDPPQTSPTSIGSIGTIGSLLGPPGNTVGSPQPLSELARAPEPTSPEDANKAMSYPAFLTPQANDASRRGMSLPHSSIRTATRSPSSSNKKHKCPYCSTEFTRHHNLKSHLLTHSQEKPYVCSTCNSRFRRLHDLKRHTKLHTGERPHVCPKCNRKFARGDALARHNKGPGGCAGRRASMGSYNGDDDVEGDDTMGDVVYDEPEGMDGEDAVGKGAPIIRRQPASGDDSIDHGFNRMPSTYPPIQGRPQGSFPPPTAYAQQSPGPVASPSPYMTGGTGSLRPAPSASLYPQNPMVESPKPLSPRQKQQAGTVDSSRNRSESASTYQQSYPPRSSTGTNSLGVPHPHHLPPPTNSLNPPDPRYTLPSQAAPTHPPTGPVGPPTNITGSVGLSSHSNSSGHGLSGHSSAEGHKGHFPTNEERLWATIRSLEQNVERMNETITVLRGEVAGLQRQLTDQQSRTT